MNEDVKEAFTPKPMISYRSSRKISSYLVRAKLYPINRTVGCYKCGSCTSTVTGETFKINHRFGCNDKCLVCFMTYNTDQFRSRWNNCKSKSRSFDRREKCAQEHWYKYFESERHSGFHKVVSVFCNIN